MMKANGVDDSVNIRTYVYIENERSHVGFMSGAQNCIPEKQFQIILNVFYQNVSQKKKKCRLQVI